MRPRLSALPAFGLLVALFAAWPAQAAGPVDYCAYGRTGTVFIVDRTTRYDELDRSALIEGVRALFSSLGAGDRLIVHTIGADYANSEKIFEGCRPGCRNVTIADWLGIGDCIGAQARQDRRAFERELVQALRPILDNQSASERSEILQTISFLSRQYTRKGVDRLIVYTDLLENSRALPWPAILETAPEALRTQVRDFDTGPELAGSDVVIYGVGRTHTGSRAALEGRQLTNLMSFWEGYLAEDGGADSVSITQRWPG